MPRILIVDDDRTIRRTLESVLVTWGYEVELACDGREAVEKINAGGLDLCLLDMGLPVLDGMGVLRVLETQGRMPIIVVSARDDVASTVEAVKLGAYDYLLKPIDLDRLRLTVARALEQRATSQALARYIADEREAHGSHQLVGKSEAMRDLYKEIGAVAATRATVLLRGESGTGKELVARAIHYASNESTEPFVAVNCSAFARELLESELFGHARGAFTGAVVDKVGRLQLAANGTLFLDEIGEMPVDLQAKLLRVLQERTFERVGDTRPIRLGARVIAATHRDLDRLVEEGHFREDLYYRLRVVEMRLPPLRERKEDIPLLVDHLLAKVNRDLHVRIRYVQNEAMAKLVEYSWPGNVRELENALTRACVLAKGEVLTPDHIVLTTTPSPSYTSSAPPLSSASAMPQQAVPSPGIVSLREVERQHIVRVLAHTGWNKRRACGILVITRPTLDRKIKEFRLERPGGPKSVSAIVMPPPPSPSPSMPADAE